MKELLQKLCISACILMGLAAIAKAQTMKVESMRVASLDLSASINMRSDQNGKPCALVKVSILASNATFGGNVIGDVLRDGSDYWVYLSEGSKNLQIKHPSFRTLLVSFPKFNINSVESKKTYILDVNFNEVVDSSTPGIGLTASSTQTTASQSTGESSGTSSNSQSYKQRVFTPRKSKDWLAEFFPLNGITLGKTTYADALKMGFKRTGEDGYKAEHNVLQVGPISFWTGVTYSNNKFYDKLTGTSLPKAWKKKFGIDDSMSYNEWMAFFNSLGFNVYEVTQPTVGSYDGRDFLVAKVNAVDPKGQIMFCLLFNYGDGGATTSSPNSLYNFEVSYLKDSRYEPYINATKNSSRGVTVGDAISTLFPVYGLTLNKSTWKDAYEAGFIVKPHDENNLNDSWNSDVNGLMFWDHDHLGYFNSLYVVKQRQGMPKEWLDLGFNWGNSYNTWLNVLEDLDYAVFIDQAPTNDATSDFRAELRAISSDGKLRIDFVFTGTKGVSSTPGTLYAITMQAN